ncbi:carbon monoxide dehydrogenase [Streptomyces sp. ms191]|uniref:SRPBCC family protein n=1 Tax=unclassified Streptomyces TaxID=2593676 RepID=UPI0011CE78BC|nr:SRPBCC family protein [Streptomyces sp. ms191]TXS30658.1 carbon monoxide dehydrogenase [Streptomyces sp. ms191]
MEHEVFVPVPAEVLRATLTDPARVARCVPGLQQDADAEAGPLSGRLKVRVGGNTITYRGALRLRERDGAFVAEGEGAEARGKGSAKLVLTLVLTPVAEGTQLAFTGTLAAEGRLADQSAEVTASAGRRLMDRFAESLASAAARTAEAGALASPDADDASVLDDTADDTTDETADQSPGGTAESPPVDGAAAVAPEGETDSDSDGVDDGVEEPGRPSVFDTPVPPPSLDPRLDEEFGETPVELPAETPAVEAAHARRTMIGRSAEEVDHAPPRGRYAPVPAPDSGGSGATLRWIAPAAALALASAVVVGRALRRRR